LRVRFFFENTGQGDSIFSSPCSPHAFFSLAVFFLRPPFSLCLYSRTGTFFWISHYSSSFSVDHPFLNTVCRSPRAGFTSSRSFLFPDHCFAGFHLPKVFCLTSLFFSFRELLSSCRLARFSHLRHLLPFEFLSRPFPPPSHLRHETRPCPRD